MRDFQALGRRVCGIHLLEAFFHSNAIPHCLVTLSRDNRIITNQLLSLRLSHASVTLSFLSSWDSVFKLRNGSRSPIFLFFQRLCCAPSGGVAVLELVRCGLVSEAACATRTRLYKYAHLANAFHIESSSSHGAGGCGIVSANEC